MYSILRPLWILLLMPILVACDVTVASPNKETVTSNPDETTTPSSTTPEISNQLVSTSTSSSRISGEISFTLGDSSLASLNIVTAPQYGEARIISQLSGSFEYDLTDTQGLMGDSFIVEVNNGEAIASAIISLKFIDSSVPTISFKPLDNANKVDLETELRLDSDDPLDVSTVTVQSNNGACSGSIQLSADNFITCVGLTGLTSSDLSRTFIASPIDNLEEATTYQLKATNDIKNYFSLSVTETIQSFTTIDSGLVINEVGSSYYANSLRWFELYNGTTNTYNLSDYELKSFSINSGTNTVSSGTFALPSVSVLPDQYLIVRAQSWDEDYGNTDTVIYLKDGNEYPYWTEDGFLELIETATGDTVDFITFGQSYSPTGNATAWSGGAATLISSSDSFGQSIGRNAIQTDTNAAEDWYPYNPGTFGSVNDVECATDNDNDMIPDCNEAEGKTFAGMPLYEWGARSGITDIFIEVDYMDSTDEGIIPRKEALDMVVAAFAEKNINVHFDVGDLFDQSSGINPAMHDLGGGDLVPLVDGMTFNPDDTRADFYDYKDAYFNSDRLQFFHYMIMANSQNTDGSYGSSGLAEISSNDLLITLGNWGLDSSIDLNKLIAYQAGTIMHELGHNLGLRHGGDEELNDKPNYLSVMNYSYQLQGLSEIGNNEGDRMHLNLTNACSGALVNGPTSSYLNFNIGYSDGSSMDLDESNLNEPLGLGRVGSAAVDFNCNSDSTETAVAFNINGDDSLSTLTDYDDWSNLETDFGGIASISTHGVQKPQASTHEFIVWPAKILNDRASSYVQETLTKPAD